MGQQNPRRQDQVLGHLRVLDTRDQAAHRNVRLKLAVARVAILNVPFDTLSIVRRNHRVDERAHQLLN